MTDDDAIVRTGLEVALAGGRGGLAGYRRVGLITNQTGVDRGLRSGIDRLHEADGIELTALFGPEHGVRGEAQAGVEVGAGVDRRTGLPVHSLYGETQRPTGEMLAGLEALVFDIQDVGVRYATYISTLFPASLPLDRAQPGPGLLTGTRPLTTVARRRAP